MDTWGDYFPPSDGYNRFLPLRGRWKHRPPGESNPEGELLAWRLWSLCRWSSDGRLRLASITSRWAWDGPVFRAHALPTSAVTEGVGVHTLKGKPCARNVGWCWLMPVMGWVALSGRVVEHENGYRAERVVIRRLRLTDGAYIVLRDAESVRMAVKELEDRYQAPVKTGWRERAAPEPFRRLPRPWCPSAPSRRPRDGRSARK